MDKTQRICTLEVLTKEILENCEKFTCGDDDMDEFFYKSILQAHARKSHRRFFF